MKPTYTPTSSTHHISLEIFTASCKLHMSTTPQQHAMAVWCMPLYTWTHGVQRYLGHHWTWQLACSDLQCCCDSVTPH